MADPKKNPTPPRVLTARVTKAIIDKRVSIVSGWLIQGHRFGVICQLAAEAAKKETEARTAAATAKTAPPAYVWGVAAPSERTLERYLASARAGFEAEGRELTRKGVEVLGLTWQRSNDLYWRALAEKRYATCRMILRDQMEMFGLIGAIKVQLVDKGTADGVEPDTSHLPETEHTEEQLNRQWRELLVVGLARVRADPDKYKHPLGLPPGPPVRDVAAHDASIDHDHDHGDDKGAA